MKTLKEQLLDEHRKLTEAMHRFNILYDKAFGCSVDPDQPLKKLFMIKEAVKTSEQFVLRGTSESIIDNNPHSKTFGQTVDNPLTPDRVDAKVTKVKDPEVTMNEYFWADKRFSV